MEKVDSNTLNGGGTVVTSSETELKENGQVDNLKKSIENMENQNAPTSNSPVDETEEPMLKNTFTPSIVTPKKDQVEATDLKNNGDAKININMSGKKLCGMTKDELMKYADDPFWIRLRWFLFILFWLAWLAMLAGAIVIIVMAKKCAPPEPKTWYEQSPIIELDMMRFKDLEPVLDSLKNQNVQAVSLKPIYLKDAPGQVVDFRSVDPKLGTMTDFEDFIKKANANGQKVILEIDPNHSSMEHSYFKKSVKRDEPYTTYYVWHPGMPGDDGKTVPPSLGVELSSNNGPGWTYNADRKEYYFHQFNETQPDFNFRSQNVIDEFKDILTHWLGLGVSGFRLSNTRYLIEILTGFIRTKDNMDNRLILRQWRDLVLNKTNGEGLFALSDGMPNDVLQTYNDNTERSVDLPGDVYSSRIFESPSTSAEKLNETIRNLVKNNDWPSLDLRDGVTKNAVDNLKLMTLLLPVTPILKPRENINDTFNKAFSAIAKHRSDPSFLFGSTQIYLLNNNTVFAYTRLKSGNPGILVTYNSGNTQAVVDFSEVQYVSRELEVIYSANPTVSSTEKKKLKVRSNNVQIPPKSTAAFTFVPDMKK